MMKLTQLLTTVVLLAALFVLTGCDGGSQGTAQDKANLDRLSEEGMSAPSNQQNFQQPGEPAQAGSGQSMNPPPPDYTGN